MVDQQTTPKLHFLLSRFVEFYVLRDLRSMASPQLYGGCGYAAVFTCLSTMELLGLVVRAEEYDAVDGKPGFEYYWREYFVKVRPIYGRNGVSTLFWELFRHGIAHAGMSKAGVAITKLDPERHMTVEGETLWVDCAQFVSDFLESYHDHFKVSLENEDVQGRAEDNASAYFDDIVASFSDQHRRTIERLRTSGGSPT